MLKINNRFLSLYDYNFLLMNQGLEKIFSLKPKTRHDIISAFLSFKRFPGHHLAHHSKSILLEMTKCSRPGNYFSHPTAFSFILIPSGIQLQHSTAVLFARPLLLHPLVTYFYHLWVIIRISPAYHPVLDKRLMRRQREIV